MKIAFVTPSLAFGGRERVLSKLINYFVDKGEEVHLIMYGKKRSIHFSLKSNVIIHEPMFEFHRSEQVFALRSLLFIRKTIRENGIDTMVSFEEKWNRFALLSVVGLNIRKVVSNRNNPYRDYGFVDRHLANLLYPKADVLIAQTSIAKEVYEKRYKLKKCVIIGNPIDQIEDDENNIQRENIVICVARLMKSKNHDRLIEIFSKTNHKGWKLYIVGGAFGKTDLSVSLKEKAKALGIEDDVIFTGSTDDVNSYLLRSKIFAFTSDHEGFPNSIGEAMAAGLPVVSYDCVAGPSDMIDDGINGFLVPVFDDDTFVEKLNYLMSNSDVVAKMGEAAKTKMKQFDSTAICEHYYNTICNE